MSEFDKYTTSIIVEHNIKYEVITTFNNTIMWYIPNTVIWHREYNPAVIFNNGTLWWYKNGFRHNRNGPAIINDNGSIEYWINGKKLNATNHKEFELAKKLIILE